MTRATTISCTTICSKHVNIDLARTNIPDGTEPDSDKECARYNNVIKEIGGVDLQLLGLGHNGHIGFNEPDDLCYSDPLRRSAAQHH